jgi:hypothetical protein
MSEKIQRPLSIEQAGNFLREKNETMAEDAKQAAKAAPISFATPGDRTKYLIYGISLMEDVSESTKNTWCSITGKAHALYTTKAVCDILRKLLVLRINGYSIQHIAHHLHTDVVTLGKVEKLAIDTIMQVISRKQNTEIPIIGG